MDERIESPIKRKFEWKSDVKKFNTYDRDFQQTVEINPDELIVMDSKNAITGWDDKSQSKIFSNQIYRTNDEELSVRSWKGGELFNGLYNDIKDKLAAINCKFNRVLVVTENGETNEYYLKGAVLKAYLDECKSIDTSKYKIKIGSISDEKKGAIKYSVPHFVQGSLITDKEKEDVKVRLQELREFNAQFASKGAKTEDLPF